MTDAAPPDPVTLPPGLGKLSPTVAMALGNMSNEQRDIFDHEYGKARRSAAAMVTLAILFPIQFFLLDKSGLGVAFWLTSGFFIVGWVVYWFLTPRLVREYNERLANETIRNIRYASAQ